MESTLTISQRGEERIRNGHFWIYRGDVLSGEAWPGEVVRVISQRGRFLAKALYSDKSQITLRVLTGHDVPVDRAFWRGRLEQALRFRQRLGIDATAYRVTHGEGDLLPSLVVDRYGDYLSLQALSQGMDRLQPLLTEILV
jgi:23S rRNA (cytosine1962-C5)-methyltransferase